MNNPDTSIEAVEIAASYLAANPHWSLTDTHGRPFVDDAPLDAAILLRALAAKCDALFAEVERCHERLEIDHVWKIGDGGIGVARVDVPMSERAEMPDAVTCRDATIELLESTKDEHIADRKAYGQQVAEAALREAANCMKPPSIAEKEFEAYWSGVHSMRNRIFGMMEDPAAMARILETGK